MLTRLTK